MTAIHQGFKELFKDIVDSLKKNHPTKLSLKQLGEEFADAVDVSYAVVAHWRKGYPPASDEQTEKLVRELVRRTNPAELRCTFTAAWFERFLRTAGYPSQSAKRLIGILLPNQPENTVLSIRPPEQPLHVEMMFGRTRELDTLQTQLAQHHVALVTGMPGSGKTTLVSSLIQETQRDAKHTFWYTVHEQDHAETLVSRLAHHLAYYGNPRFAKQLEQGSRQPDADLLTHMLSTMSQQGYLLCLDDAHHLKAIRTQPIWDQLHKGCQQGMVDLILIGRHMPTEKEMRKPIVLKGFESNVFVQQLLAHQGLLLPETSAEALRQTTGGNPQLLLLAADILKQEQGALLNKIHDAVDIEKFLLDEIDSTLTVKEQRVMNVMAVFLGYPTTEQAIATVGDIKNAAPVLHRLRERHLIQSRGEGNEHERYSQHAIIQQFYYQRLEQAEKIDLHTRAGQYYATTEVNRLWAASHYEKAGALIDAANLLTRAQTEPAVYRGEAAATSALLSDILTQLRTHDCNQDEPAQDANGVRSQTIIDLCIALGYLYRFQGQFEQALSMFTYGLAFVRENAQTVDDEIEILYEMGWVYIRQGKYQKAVEIFDQILQLYRNGADCHQLGYNKALNGQGWAYYHLGNLEKAATAFQQVWTASSDHMTAELLANVNSGLGNIAWRRQNLDEAVQRFRESKEAFLGLSDPIRSMNSTINLGIVYTLQQNWDQALTFFEEALALAEDLGDIYVMLVIQYNISQSYVRQRQFGASIPYLRDAESLAKEMGLHQRLIQIYAGLANAELNRNNIEQTDKYVQQALPLLQEHGTDADIGIIQYLAGAVAQANQEPAQALRLLDIAIPLLEKTHETMYLVEAEAVKKQVLAMLASSSE